MVETSLTLSVLEVIHHSVLGQTRANNVQPPAINAVPLWRYYRKNLGRMDLKTTNASPVLTDPAPINKSRLGIHSGLFPYSQSGPSFSSGILTTPRKKPGKLDDARSNGWLDAMKSSSPPSKKMLKDFNVEMASDDDIAYYSWMLKYPSAIKSSFEKIINHARNKKIVMFLDYDGTLSPIVDDPDRAFMSDEMRSTVRNVSTYFPTAIISGRSRDKVYELVGLAELYYAGSHGMDIMCPDRETVFADPSNSIKSTGKHGKELNLFQPAREFLPMIDEVFRTLVENTKDIKGTKVENHKFCASVHYRNVDEKSWSTIAQRVHNILKDYPRLRLTHGRKVLEVRLSNGEDVLPIYIGDDKTDEDAFKCITGGEPRLWNSCIFCPKRNEGIFLSQRYIRGETIPQVSGEMEGTKCTIHEEEEHQVTAVQHCQGPLDPKSLYLYLKLVTIVGVWNFKTRFNNCKYIKTGEQREDLGTKYGVQYSTDYLFFWSYIL
ncbi:unnamed protein product [Camellia sinensis]